MQSDFIYIQFFRADLHTLVQLWVSGLNVIVPQSVNNVDSGVRVRVVSMLSKVALATTFLAVFSSAGSCPY